MCALFMGEPLGMFTKGATTLSPVLHFPEPFEMPVHGKAWSGIGPRYLQVWDLNILYQNQSDLGDTTTKECKRGRNLYGTCWLLSTIHP